MQTGGRGENRAAVSGWPHRAEKTVHLFGPHYQHLHEVRDYFGDHVALYCAGMGLYTQGLIYPAVLGALTMCWGVDGDTNPLTLCEACPDGKTSGPAETIGADIEKGFVAEAWGDFPELDSGLQVRFGSGVAAIVLGIGAWWFAG